MKLDSEVIYMVLALMIFKPYEGFHLEDKRKLVGVICIANLIFGIIVLIIGDVVLNAFVDSVSTYFYFMIGSLGMFYRVYVNEPVSEDDLSKELPKINAYDIQISITTIILGVILIFIFDREARLPKYIIDLIFLIQIWVNRVLRRYIRV